MPIRIAIICPGQFMASSDRSSSVERVCCEMSKQLPQHCSVTIYSKLSGDAPAVEQQGLVTHRRFHASDRKAYMRQVIRDLRRSKPDIIQIENRPLIASQLRRYFPSLPIVLSLHSTTFVNPKTYGRRLLARCLSRVDRIIVNSAFLADWLARRLGVPRKKLTVCYPGVDTELFVSRFQPAGRERREMMREELGYANKTIVLFVGRLIPLKGVHHLLAAFRRVIAEHPEALLLICGSAKYGSDRLTPYVKKLHQLGGTMPNHVRFVPFIPHSSVVSWYLAADIVVVPSTGEEAFGLVNVEALASGAPVVAARVGGIAEIIRHDVNGCLIDPKRMQEELAHALNDLLRDHNRRGAMGKEGTSTVARQFTWRMTAARYAAVYEQIVAAKRA